MQHCASMQVALGILHLRLARTIQASIGGAKIAGDDRTLSQVNVVESTGESEAPIANFVGPSKRRLANPSMKSSSFCRGEFGRT